MRGDNLASRISIAPYRRNRSAWLLLAGGWMLAGIGVLWAQPPATPGLLPGTAASARVSPPGADAIPADAEDDSLGQLRREGTQLRDERGQFALNGTRVIFVSADDKRRFVGLENLALQRISQLVGGDFNDVEWIVSGLVTEYQGANYLLILRATKAAPGSGRRRSF
jgi:hypothetical protein